MLIYRVDEIELGYTTRLSRKAKHIGITVFRDLRVVVTVPYGVSLIKVEKFLEEKKSWILKKLLHFKKLGTATFLKTTKKDYLRLKADGLVLVKNKISEWNRVYKLPVGKISIRNQTTRWGSCSKAKNLNFNFKVVYLPEKLVDYLVVHELCHIQEFNHSKKFWNLVSIAIPDFKQRRKELKLYKA